jgi:adenylyltransferase/sulfurtransferase
LNDVNLNPQELERYARHITLGQVGLEGQERLKAAKVLCIGSGGLGSPVAMYLAAAGVGQLGLVDADIVDRSNLHRQLLHGESDIGTKKLESAQRTLREINPHVTLDCHDVFFKASNAMEIARGYDLIVDGTDNFPTRYLSNDVAHFLKIPNVYGSIYQFEGQVSVFASHQGGPCYRCLFPTPPKPGLVPSCAEGGVFGVLPGLMGSLQATEAIKWILGIGKSLAGRLMHVDTLSMRVRNFNLRQDPQCPLCGDHPEITELIDYEAFCGIAEIGESTVEEVSAEELAVLLEEKPETLVLVDVREDFERAICKIDQATAIRLSELPNQLGSLPSDRLIIFHCKTGVRSESAVNLAQEAGIKNVAHLAGGILAWKEKVAPEMNGY